MENFEIIGPVRSWSAKFGEVNLLTISEAQAEKLYQAGFPYLRKLENKSPEPKKLPRKRR